MPATIKDIALAAGTSRGTVDRVLNGRGNVKPDIVQRVRAAADALQYLPNRAGKELAALKKPLTLGFVSPSRDNSFFDDILKGAQDAACRLSDFGVTMVMKAVKGYHEEEHARAISEAIEEGAQGLCVCSMDVPGIRLRVNRAVENGVPVVAVNNDLTGTSRLCYVGCDYTATGRTAAGLFRLLHRPNPEVLIVTGSLDVQGHNQRISGFKESLSDSGVEYELAGVVESQDDDSVAYENVLRFFEKHPNVNCVYCTAAGVSGVARALRKLDAQKRVLLLTFDAVPAVRKLMREGLVPATICQQPREQGYRAVKLLFENLVYGTLPPEHSCTDAVIKLRENL